MEQGDEKDGVAPLLFKSPICRLPQNRTLAEIQLSAQTHSFNRKPQTQRHSHSWRNCLKIVMPKQPPTSKKGEKCWHLPMFSVYHPKKPTKIQVVCNSSAKHIGISFNDVQIIGPDLNNTLIQSPHLFLQSHYSRHWTDVSLLPGEKGTQEFFWGESYPRAVNYSLINPDSDREIQPQLSTLTTFSRNKQLGSVWFEKFSTWLSLTGALANLIHITHTFHQAQATTNGRCAGWHYCQKACTIEELSHAKNTIIWAVQDIYAKELLHIKESQEPLKDKLPQGHQPFHRWTWPAGNWRLHN